MACPELVDDNYTSIPVLSTSFLKVINITEHSDTNASLKEGIPEIELGRT